MPGHEDLQADADAPTTVVVGPPGSSSGGRWTAARLTVVVPVWPARSYVTVGRARRERPDRAWSGRPRSVTGGAVDREDPVAVLQARRPCAGLAGSPGAQARDDVDRHDAVGERDHRRLLAGLGVVGRVGRVGQADEDRGEPEGDDREREVGDRAGAPSRSCASTPGSATWPGARPPARRRRPAASCRRSCTKPPSGMPLRPYSVSPRLNDHRVGPKPTKYWVTFMPKALAVPHVTGLMQADRDQDAQREQDDPEDLHPEAPARFPTAAAIDRAGSGAGPRLGGQHVIDGTWFGEIGCLVEHPLDGVDDAEERQPALREGGHALLVGGVVDRRPAAPGPSGRLGQLDRRERLVVERRELPGVRLRSSRPPRPLRAPGPASPGASAIGSRMSGGLAWAIVEPSTNSTIEWITDCGWTTTSIASYGTSNSSCASITSSALVDHGGRVDRDDRPHVPGRVGERLLRGDLGQLGPRPAAERAAARGEDQPAHLGRACPPRRHWASAECSESTGTIWPGSLHRRLDQRAAGDERLLVGQREGTAGAQRGQRRREAERARPRR